MTDQLNITFPPHQAAETSREAARQIAGDVNALQRRVLDVLKRFGAFGCTDRELENATGLIGSTLRPRRCELREKGLIRDSGKRRPTPSGRPAIVWVVTKDDV